MLRVSIRATPDTDVEAEAAKLRRIAEKSVIKPGPTDRIVDETRVVLCDFVSRGQELSALGSQLAAERAIRGDGYEIHVTFNSASKPRLFQRIRNALRR